MNSYKAYFKFYHVFFIIYLGLVLFFYPLIDADFMPPALISAVFMLSCLLIVTFSKLEIIKLIIHNNKTNQDNPIALSKAKSKHIICPIILVIILLTSIFNFLCCNMFFVACIYTLFIFSNTAKTTFFNQNKKKDRPLKFLYSLAYNNRIFKKSSNFIFKKLSNQISKQETFIKFTITIVLLILSVSGMILGFIDKGLGYFPSNIRHLYATSEIFVIVFSLMLLYYKTLLDGLNYIENFKSKQSNTPIENTFLPPN